MQKTLLLTFLIMGLLVGVFVFAQITFPVKELGNCQSETECKAYCDNVNHVEECLDFAKIHNLLTPTELAEVEKIAKVWKEGVIFPGNCQTKAECEAYCDGPEHIDECLDFAERAGVISPQELREGRQIAKALAMGLKMPGNCWGKEECDAYCSGSSHWQECVTFAKAAGLISKKQAAEAEKVMPMMVKGETPGGCKSKVECQDYCANESHIDECVQFAQKAGLMNEEEIEIFQKTKGKRPGNCSSEEECEAFCNRPENQETCFEFAAQHGLISQEEVQRIRDNLEKMYQGFQQANQQVIDCLNSAIGAENVEKIRSRNFMPTSQIGEQIRSCFEKYMSPPQEKP